MKEDKKFYFTPVVEVLNARVERGFEGSDTPTPSEPEPDPSDQFNAGGYTGWTDGGNTNSWFS